MLLIPYLSIAIRSRPIPNANPLYSFVSMPQPSSTFLFTTPAPSTSIQPVPLHKEQPLPWHWKQLTSTSTDGSVNGKYEGRRRVVTFFPNIFFTSWSSIPFKSHSVIPLSTTRPSICVNIGECVASSSERKTLPGETTLIGGFFASIT